MILNVYTYIVCLGLAITLLHNSFSLFWDSSFLFLWFRHSFYTFCYLFVFQYIFFFLSQIFFHLKWTILCESNLFSGNLMLSNFISLFIWSSIITHILPLSSSCCKDLISHCLFTWLHSTFQNVLQNLSYISYHIHIFKELFTFFFSFYRTFTFSWGLLEFLMHALYRSLHFFYLFMFSLSSQITL